MNSNGIAVESQGRSSSSIEVFFSYSHEDEELRNELEKHLALLKRQGVISIWHDRCVAPGQEWAGEISAHLDSADLVLLLISPGFMQSNYCYDVEMRRALERNSAGLCSVIPIILKPVDWQEAPFAKLQALPRGVRPVTTWSNRDEAFYDIVVGIRHSIQALAQTSTRSLGNMIFRAKWRESVELLDRRYREMPEYTEAHRIIEATETAFSRLYPQDERFEETKEWRKGAAAIAELSALRLRNQSLNDLVISVKVELAKGIQEVAREFCDMRCWRHVILLTQQVLILIPDHGEALRMRADSERALAVSAKDTHRQW
jgi:hypothetical protein